METYLGILYMYSNEGSTFLPTPKITCSWKIFLCIYEKNFDLLIVYYCMQYFRHALLDLAITMLPYVDKEHLKQIYAIAVSNLQVWYFAYSNRFSCLIGIFWNYIILLNLGQFQNESWCAERRHHFFSHENPLSHLIETHLLNSKRNKHFKRHIMNRNSSFSLD